jgi:hypothetical protein
MVLFSLLKDPIAGIDKNPMGTRVKYELDDSLPPVALDDSKIFQSALNIIKNAEEAKMRDKDLEITIKTKRYRHYVEIVISDNGSGMSEETKKRLFEWRYTTKSDRGGTGLGMAISRKIIEAQGGVLDFDSALGKGTSFFILLPIDRVRLDPHITYAGHVFHNVKLEDIYPLPKGEAQASQAMIVSPGAHDDYGGIDFTPARINLQTQNNGANIKFHIDPAMLQRLQNVPGFVPTIINIQPMNDLKKFLGINDSSPI